MSTYDSRSGQEHRPFLWHETALLLSPLLWFSSSLAAPAPSRSRQTGSPSLLLHLLLPFYLPATLTKQAQPSKLLMRMHNTERSGFSKKNFQISFRSGFFQIWDSGQFLGKSPIRQTAQSSVVVFSWRSIFCGDGSVFSDLCVLGMAERRWRIQSLCS